MLHYIHYLQRSIAVAKALLKLHAADGKGGLGGKSVRPAFLGVSFMPSVVLAARDPEWLSRVQDHPHPRPLSPPPPHLTASGRRQSQRRLSGKIVAGRDFGAGSLRTVEWEALPGRRDNLGRACRREETHVECLGPGKRWV